MAFVFVYTQRESHTMHNSIIPHSSKLKKENITKNEKFKSMQILNSKRKNWKGTLWITGWVIFSTLKYMPFLS